MPMKRWLRRAHIWLGWAVGLQLLAWTVSGLVMTAMPIDQVRGEDLKRELPAATLAGPFVAPEAILRAAGAGGDSLTLRSLGGRAVYEWNAPGQPPRLFDARGGAAITLGAGDVVALARARYAGAGRVANVTRVDPARIPLDLRRDDPAWRVAFDDERGTIFYLHATTGDLLAVRTDGWRLFDFMWGLHIMAYREREDINHPVLIAAAALALATVVAGGALLFRAGCPCQARPARRAVIGRRRWLRSGSCGRWWRASSSCSRGWPATGSMATG